VCRPSVEAQAIKRAHRIGQDREVRVETLVLKGTVEEKMFERSRRMSRAEHRDAKVLEDDGGIKDIVKNAGLLEFEEGEDRGHGQVALLDGGERVWCREGWWGWDKGRWQRKNAGESGGRKRKRNTGGEKGKAKKAKGGETEKTVGIADAG